MNTWLFVIIPLGSAITGWIIARLLVYFMVKRVFIAKQPRIAEQVGKFASSQLNPETIVAKISSPENLQQVMPLIETHIDEFLRHKLAKEIPMLSMLIGDKTISLLKQVFMRELEIIFPQVMNQYATNLATRTNIGFIIETKLKEVSSTEWKTLIKQHLGGEISKFYLLSAAIGLILGLCEALVVLLIAKGNS